jgi:hypothetical protein
MLHQRGEGGRQAQLNPGGEGRGRHFRRGVENGSVCGFLNTLASGPESPASGRERIAGTPVRQSLSIGVLGPQNGSPGHGEGTAREKRSLVAGIVGRVPLGGVVQDALGQPGDDLARLDQLPDQGGEVRIAWDGRIAAVRLP